MRSADPLDGTPEPSRAMVLVRESTALVPVRPAPLVRARPAHDPPEHVAAFPPLLLTAAETAVLLRTSRKAIYALIERNQLAGVRRIGRRVLIHRDELLDSLRERRTPSPGRIRR